MTSNRNRRIAKEIVDIQSDSLSNIQASPVGNGEDLTHLKGSFKGPPGTPYEGGTFQIDVRLASDYPFKPPIMKFDTKIWHPNVSSQTVPSPYPIGRARLTRESGCHLPRYPFHRLVSRPDGQIGSLVAAIAPQHTRTQGSTGRRSRRDVDTEPQRVRAGGAGMVGQIRRGTEAGAGRGKWWIRNTDEEATRKKIQGGRRGRKGCQVRILSESEGELEADVCRYHGYNQNMIDGFVFMGFDLERVVAAFEFVGIDHNDGEEYALEEAYIGDITARLLGEP